MCELTWTPKEVTLTKQWAKAHGYQGRGGGWIYDKHGAKVCQGWWKFYSVWHQEILSDHNGHPVDITQCIADADWDKVCVGSWTVPMNPENICGVCRQQFDEGALLDVRGHKFFPDHEVKAPKNDL